MLERKAELGRLPGVKLLMELGEQDEWALKLDSVIDSISNCRGEMVTSILLKEFSGRVVREHILEAHKEAHGPRSVTIEGVSTMPEDPLKQSHCIKGALDPDGNPVTGSREMYIQLPDGYTPGQVCEVAVAEGLPGAGQKLFYKMPPGVRGGQMVMLPVKYIQEPLVKTGNDRNAQHTTDSSDTCGASSGATMGTTGNDQAEPTDAGRAVTRSMKKRKERV